jgi:hypothetical protein
MQIVRGQGTFSLGYRPLGGGMSLVLWGLEAKIQNRFTFPFQPGEKIGFLFRYNTRFFRKA